MKSNASSRVTAWRTTLPWLSVFVAGLPAYAIWRRCAKPRVESVV